ncbi:hypothetical protein NA56DRAFT_702891 [Hyaloscypha hepaticicola]|uniref:Uncharacterized protein n=1 Tax=Hyaloscypha hepaticicola TaxID=2082293 RepID=A0A2J6Q6K7_9HELO|nr:hypothetical protein NA56DRAFT_702891 [Hyaloscypha hepaticicola]
MAVCPDFIHVVLVCVAYTRYTVRRTTGIPALPSSQLTNPAAAPSLVQPGPSAATKALDGQLEPHRHPHPPPRQPLPSPGSSTTDEFVALRACGGTSNSHRPGSSCQPQGQTHSTIEPLASLSAPESTGVEGIQVGRIASQHPFAGPWALACVSD